MQIYTVNDLTVCYTSNTQHCSLLTYVQYTGMRIEFDNALDCFKILEQHVRDTPSEQYVLSIVQHLMFVRDDILIRCVLFCVKGVEKD